MRKLKFKKKYGKTSFFSKKFTFLSFSNPHYVMDAFEWDSVGGWRRWEKFCDNERLTKEESKDISKDLLSILVCAKESNVYEEA